MKKLTAGAIAGVCFGICALIAIAAITNNVTTNWRGKISAPIISACCGHDK